MVNAGIDPKCKICSAANWKIKYSLPRFDLCVCQECGHLFSIIKVETEHYRNDYFSDQHKDYFEKPDIRFFNQIHSLTKEHFGTTSGLVLLDVGTGFGTLPQHFKGLGYDSYGIDISQDAINYGANQLKIAGLEAVAIENYTPGKTFDVITCSNVIEHIPDPIAFLTEARRLLSPNGVLICDTPDSNSFIFSLAKFIHAISGGIFYKSLERVCEVHHLHHFNQGSLAKAFENSGFKITRRFYRNLALETISLTPAQRAIVRILYFFSNLFQSYFLQGAVCMKTDTRVR